MDRYLLSYGLVAAGIVLVLTGVNQIVRGAVRSGWADQDVLAGFGLVGMAVALLTVGASWWPARRRR